MTTLTEILPAGATPAAGAIPARGLTARVVETDQSTLVEILRGDEVVLTVQAFDSPS